MNYGIVIFPKKEVQDRANALRKRYDSHYNFVPPHITLKEAFETDNIDDAVRHLEEVTKNFAPFTLRINKIKAFIPTSPVVYFAFEDNTVMTKLHEEINSGVLHHETKFNFIPHITIAQDLPTPEIQDIYDRLRLKDFDMSFEVDRIHLLYQIDNGFWTNYQTFLLRG